MDSLRLIYQGFKDSSLIRIRLGTYQRGYPYSSLLTSQPPTKIAKIRPVGSIIGEPLAPL